MKTRTGVRVRIEPFVRKNHIDMSEFEPIEYRSFAEFFDRRFRPGVRNFPTAAGEMGAFAEARYFAWERQPTTMCIIVTMGGHCITIAWDTVYGR
jgi:hypothetical protein